MIPSERLALIEIFEQSAASRRRALASDEFKWTMELQRRRETLQKKERDADDAIWERAEHALRHTLDRYDTAIVEALMENEDALGKTRKAREDIEAKAYTLPDGRKVFKSSDGRHVYDQDGVPLSTDVVDPNAIPDGCPIWEKFSAAKDAERKLLRERQELHDFQKKVDDARDTLDKGGAADLDALGADLKRAMPETVRRKLGGDEPAAGPEAPQPAQPPQDVPPGQRLGASPQPGAPR